MGLWILFSFLNVLIPILSITRGKWMLTKITAASNQRINGAAILTIILFNAVYIPTTATLHIRGRYPNVLNCVLSTNTHPCKVPPTATSYSYVLGIVITKTVILPIALLTELMVGLAIAFSGKRPMTNKLSVSLLKAFIVWQLLVFVQIAVGLISIPLLVLTFISPANVILSIGVILLCSIMIIFIVATIPLPKSYKSPSLHSCISIIETLFITAVVLAAFYTYSTIVQEGMNLDGVKGYILSLAPTIPVSIFLWFIKKKYFGQQFWKTGQMVKKDALSKEEMITLLVPTEDLDQVV